MTQPAPPWTVLVTRPAAQAPAWVQRLVAQGVSAQALPLMRIEADAQFVPAVQSAWSALTSGTGLPDTRSTPSAPGPTTLTPIPAATWALVMFVSPNAVLQFFAQRPQGGVSGSGMATLFAIPPGRTSAWPPATLAGATGPGTVAALLDAGVPPECIAQPRVDATTFDAEALWRDALASRDWRGRAVLIVRGDSGRDWLAGTLRAAGAVVTLLSAYRQLDPDWSALLPSAADHSQTLADALQAVVRAARAGRYRPAWLFSSSRAVQALDAQVASQDVSPVASQEGRAAGAGLPVADGPFIAPDLSIVRRWPVLATHPRIAEAARAAGFLTVWDVRPDPADVAARLANQPAEPARPTAALDQGRV